MRKREPHRLTWRDTALGFLTEFGYAFALMALAGLVAVAVAWGYGR